MKEHKTLHQLIGEHRTLFIVIAVVLFLIEIEIFAVAALKSGRRSVLQIVNENGMVIHETDGDHLSDFNKYYFEKTFGPLERYQVRLKTERTPFPFRAWFTAAVGVPVGIVLLFAFILKAYSAMFVEEEKEAPASAEPEGAMEKIVERISRFNIFIIGGGVFILVMAYWTLPNLLMYVGKIGVETIDRYKWFIVGAAVVLVGIGAWIIYLRYLLAKKSIESRAEVEKYRMRLEYGGGQAQSPRLTCGPPPDDRSLPAPGEKTS